MSDSNYYDDNYFGCDGCGRIATMVPFEYGPAGNLCDECLQGVTIGAPPNGCTYAVYAADCDAERPPFDEYDYDWPGEPSPNGWGGWTFQFVRCGCENSHCTEQHDDGACDERATVPCMWIGGLCSACAQHMPDSYLTLDTASR